MTDATRALVREVREALGKATPGPWAGKCECHSERRFRFLIGDNGRMMYATLSPLCESDQVEQMTADYRVVSHAVGWLAALCDALEEAETPADTARFDPAPREVDGNGM